LVLRQIFAPGERGVGHPVFGWVQLFDKKNVYVYNNRPNRNGRWTDVANFKGALL